MDSVQGVRFASTLQAIINREWVEQVIVHLEQGVIAS